MTQCTDKLSKGTENSSFVTNSRAADLADAIGAYHLQVVSMMMKLVFR